MDYGFYWSRSACCLVLLGAAGVSGCDDIVLPTERPVDAPAEIGRDFDAATAGAIHGQVMWDGAIPEVLPYRAPVSPGIEHSGGSRRYWPNPNAPHIDPRTKAVAGAVVFLRGVDPNRSRPWDHSPVCVELRDYQLYVLQGDAEGSSGFVRRGDSITMMSRHADFQSLQVRGTAFFTRAFPDADRPCTQRLDRSGVVELMSGSGHFWMRGWLFVDDHPYYTHTNAEGRFNLPKVPSGDYELVCWHPNWHESARELDAETALICRLAFGTPFEVAQSVRLRPGQTRTVSIRLPAERFRR